MHLQRFFPRSWIEGFLVDHLPVCVALSKVIPSSNYVLQSNENPASASPPQEASPQHYQAMPSTTVTCKTLGARSLEARATTDFGRAAKGGGP